MFTCGPLSVHVGLRQCVGEHPQTGRIDMRKAFHEELDRITEELVEMTRLAG